MHTQGTPIPGSVSSRLSANMSLREKIGQLLMVGFPGPVATPEVLSLIRTHHVGGVVLFARNLGTPAQIQALTASLQQAAREGGQRYPILISVDQENGQVRRFGESATTFPGNMALGAIDGEQGLQMTQQIAYASGRELKALGINMNLAPVADVNNNPANPVIGVRSFGEDPQQVGAHVAAMVRGYREAGIISNLKHFPGHGDTAIDSHLNLPTLPFDRQRLDNIELVPFRQGIAAGADSIMSGHLYLPELMPAGQQLPATISPEIIQQLLREELGYQGVVITDCLCMKAVADTVGIKRGAILALKAGNDIVLISHAYDLFVPTLDAIEAALTDGELSMDMIDTAVERILALKARMLSWDDLPTPDALQDIKNPAHLQLGTQAYEQSTTLVRDQQQLLPLNLTEEQRLLVIRPPFPQRSLAMDGGDPTQYLSTQLQQRHANTQMLSIEVENAQKVLQGIDLIASHSAMIIIVTINANLDTYQKDLVQRVWQTGKPLIGLAISNPYDLLAFPQLGTYLTTYEYTQPALNAAVRVLFGEIVAHGKLPITIEL